MVISNFKLKTETCALVNIFNGEAEAAAVSNVLAMVLLRLTSQIVQGDGHDGFYAFTYDDGQVLWQRFNMAELPNTSEQNVVRENHGHPVLHFMLHDIPRTADGWRALTLGNIRF